MNIKKQDIGVWVKADRLEPPFGWFLGRYDYRGEEINGRFYNDNTKIVGPLADIIPKEDLEWLKPIKDVYVLTEDEMEKLRSEKDLILTGIEEGSEQWKAEYDNCRELLQYLVTLKKWKDENINMDMYADLKPKAWETVKKFLEKYQHQ